MMTIIGLLLLSILVGAFSYAVVRFTAEPVDDFSRAEAPGHFAQLDDGITHYQISGPQGAPLVVMIHGLTTPSFVFDALAPRIEAAGFRTLRYDLFGRGHSDRPRVRYDLALYLRQLQGLLRAVDHPGPVICLGYSMGGMIATDFAVQNPAQNPGRVSWLVLLAPGGMGHALGPFLEWCARAGPVGAWVMETLGAPILRRAFVLRDDACQVMDFEARLMAEPGTAGYLYAVLSSVRAAMRVDQTGAHRSLQQAGVPTLAIWGAQDPVIPKSARERLTLANPDAKHVVLAEADHDLPHKFPDQVLSAFLDRG